MATGNIVAVAAHSHATLQTDVRLYDVSTFR
eukprot:CAMPEP_0168604958 /NCGR_PEP_ID=MMETSP0420-20121227/15641_1 /TAXON_ID=498008 /ORGANISM="Pessonella sp." /LENGTH=30 /DNA_ID= /DNA_START= /DNA_END= /DNA_ORIENTATION=